MVPAEEPSGDEKEEKKKAPKLERPVDKWVYNPFTARARTGDAVLHHWSKEKEVQDVYPFSRFNKRAQVVTYTPDEYKKVIAPITTDWDKLETDVLFDLCERYSLRFIVVADRFSYELAEREAELNCTAGSGGRAAKPRKRDQKALVKRGRRDRTVDEIKDRYYAVAKEVLTLRGEVKNPIVVKPFNFEMEVRRKNNLEKLFMRTKDQVEREKYLIQALKKIDQKLKKEEKEERTLAKLKATDMEYIRLPGELEKVTKSAKRDGTRAYAGVMLLSNRFQSKLPVSEQMQLQVSAALGGMKIDAGTMHASRAVLDAYDDLREELLVYFSLDKFIKDKGEEGEDVREHISELEALKAVYDKADTQAKLLRQMELQKQYNAQQLLNQQSQYQAAQLAQQQAQQSQTAGGDQQLRRQTSRTAQGPLAI